MDLTILDQLCEKYKSKNLVLDNYTIKKIGIIGNQTVLKINEFHLYCIPQNLNLNNCNILIILDKNEIDFFSKFFQKTHSIHFVFQNAMYKKQIPLFLRSKVKGIKVMNPETNHCLISLEFTVIPRDFKEILINVFKRNEALEQLFSNEQFRNRILKRKELHIAKIDDNIHLRTEEGIEPIKMIVIELSICTLKIIGEIQSPNYVVNSRIQVEFFLNDYSFYCSGIIFKRSESQEIPGYSIMEIKFDFSNNLTDLLYRYFKKQTPIKKDK